MDQRLLKALLEEAARPDCSWERRNAIHCQLTDASPAFGQDGVFEIEGRGAGMHLLLEKLYVEVGHHRPELLPTLFPVFSLICGDRKDGVLCADIDWSLV
jgi:hypothetical protein